MVSNLRKNFLCIVWHQKPTVNSFGRYRFLKKNLLASNDPKNEMSTPQGPKNVQLPLEGLEVKQTICFITNQGREFEST